MGFYSPATILNDAKRHGLKGLPIDVQHSEWFCTLEELKETDRDKYTRPFAVRVGFKYVRGLRREIGAAIAESREIDGQLGDPRSRLHPSSCENGVDLPASARM